jgi:hypothetical protein
MGGLLEVEKTVNGSALFIGVKTGAPERGDWRVMELRRWPPSCVGGCCPLTGREGGIEYPLPAEGEGDVCIGDDLATLYCIGVL